MCRTTVLVAGAIAVLLACPAAATTVDEVIAKHVEARGGKARWDAIQTIKATGTFTAFSKVSPFTLYKKRDDRYYLDHTQNDRKVVIGHDGEMAWWDNRWFGEGAQAITGIDLTAVRREFDFVTPLFDYEKKGYTVKLLGEVEYEGMPAIGVELTRDDETTETWYLDRGTYLELARVSPGSDFGTPMEQRTFFDDFRDVGGVKIPHLVETQWYTRDRVMRIEKLETNVEVDDALFRLPAPPGMGPLLPMAGRFKVAVSQRQQPGAPWQDSEREATIEALMGGVLLQERSTSGDGNDLQWNLSYDQYQKRYRMTRINSQTRYMDVEVGDFDDAGRLVVSNMDTGTPFETFGMTIHSRISIFDITQDGFNVEIEVSIDGGENWFVANKQKYSRMES